MQRFISRQWKLIYLLWMTLMLTPNNSTSAPKEHRSDFVNALSDLLGTFNIPHKQTLDSMALAAQKWRRKPGQERWELPEVKLNSQERSMVMNYLDQLGLIQELVPNHSQYDYALVLGATVPRMKRRLNHLSALWKKGVRVKKIVFLVGQRPLSEDIDQVETLIKETFDKPVPVEKMEQVRPLTEAEGARLVYESTKLPKAMRRVSVEFVDTPRRWQQDHWQRANTRDTLEHWLAQQPAPGTTLVLSDQPHANYQSEVVRQALPDDFQINLAAQAANPDTQVSIYLDALALWLHNLQKQAASYQ